MSSPKSQKGFSLIELLVVLTVVGILLAFASPSLLTLQSSSLSAKGREFGNFLHLCRSEAISERTAVRLGIVVGSPDGLHDYRRYAAWKWDKRDRQFVISSNWRTLPDDLVFAPSLPQFIQNTEYAQEEGTAVKGDYILGETSEIFTHTVTSEEEAAEYSIKYIEFSPSGRASVTDGEERNILLVMRPGDADDDEEVGVNNWFQYTVDTLTGRSRIYRP